MDSRNAQLSQRLQGLRTEILSLRSSASGDSGSFMCGAICGFADELLQKHYSAGDSIQNRVPCSSSSSSEEAARRPGPEKACGQDQLVDVILGFDRKLKSLEVRLRGVDSGILNNEIIANVNSKLTSLLSSDSAFDELVADLKTYKLTIQNVLAASGDSTHATVGGKVGALLRAKRMCDSNATSLGYIRSLLQQITAMNIYLTNSDAKMAMLADKVRATREGVRANDRALDVLEGRLRAFHQRVAALHSPESSGNRSL